MRCSELEQQWLDRLKSRPVNSVMRFADEGLVLGAGTLLSAARTSARDISLDVSDPRVLETGLAKVTITYERE